MDEVVLRPTESETQQDYYSVLARVVAAVSQDHVQLRRVIYELARFKLRKDLYSRFNDVGSAGMREQLRALDNAIDQFEVDFAHHSIPLTFSAQPAADDRADGQAAHTALRPHVASPNPQLLDDRDAPIPYSLVLTSQYGVARTSSPPAVAERGDHFAAAHPAERFRVILWSTVQLVAAAALGAAIYTAIDGYGRPRHNETEKAVAATNTLMREPSNLLSGKTLSLRSEAAFRPGLPTIPLPSAYGVYAVSDGHLTDLDLLPIRVPDPRVAISTSISTPSRVHLPIGQLQFIVFRRDLANNAPDRVALRVVARVVRALTFDSAGKATVANVDGPWVVRSNSYQMRVAPIADNPEMVVVRPEHPEFVFPAGRYALVLKNLAYDFTLDGPLTDTAHCIERTDALNVPVYTECRNL